MYLVDLIESVERALVATAISATFSAIIVCLLWVASKVTGKGIDRLPLIFLVAFVFGTLALVTGIITGASRSVAVGQVLPAALGLIGAVALYVITKSQSEIPVAATAVVAFSLLLLVGTVLGSYERIRFAAYNDAERYRLQRLKTQADVEFVINGYRRSRGLDPINFEK